MAVVNVAGAIAAPAHIETIKLNKSATKVLQAQAVQPAIEVSSAVLPNNLLSRSLKEPLTDVIDLTNRGTAADLMAETVPSSTPPAESTDPNLSPTPATDATTDIPPATEVTPSEPVSPASTDVPPASDLTPSEPVSPASTDSPPSSDVTPSEPLSPPSDESSPSQLEAQAEPENSWEFLIEPYLFLPFNLDADVTVGGRTASVEADLSDIFSLDSIFAASLRFQARRDRFGFIFDGSYLFGREKGNQEVTIPQEVVAQFGLTNDLNIRADTTVTTRLATIDLAGFYRVLDEDLGRTETGAKTYPTLILDTYAGLRINFISLDLEIDSISVNNITLNDQDLNTSVTLFEPLIGGRLGLELSDRWTIGMRGDFSGFGVNGDKNSTWNFLFGTQYWLSRSVGLQLAYRFTRLVYEDGDGQDARGIDLSQNGLWLGMIFRL